MSSGSAMGAGSDSSGFDCLECGACCQCFPIYATREDAALEPRITVNGVIETRFQSADNRAYRLYPLAFQTACPFLPTDNRCEIYKTRPQVCRSFAVGSDQCHEARQRQGII